MKFYLAALALSSALLNCTVANASQGKLSGENYKNIYNSSYAINSNDRYAKLFYANTLEGDCVAKIEQLIGIMRAGMMGDEANKFLSPMMTQEEVTHIIDPLEQVCLNKNVILMDTNSILSAINRAFAGGEDLNNLQQACEFIGQKITLAKEIVKGIQNWSDDNSSSDLSDSSQLNSSQTIQQDMSEDDDAGDILLCNGLKLEENEYNYLCDGNEPSLFIEKR